MRTLKINTISDRLISALQKSEAIQSFCMTKYKKEPVIMRGYNGKRPPSEKDCPFIALTGQVKQEGNEIGEFIYHVSLMWCVNNANITRDENSITYDGAADAAELGQLVYEAIAETSENYPVYSATTTIDAFTFVPQFPGYMESTFQIPVTMGEQIDF